MMKRQLVVLTCIIIAGLSSCGPKKYYERTENGLEYYFYEKNRDGKVGEVGDIYDLNISIATKRDSIFHSQAAAMFKRSKPIYPGDFHEGLGILHEGDSVEFILNADSFFSMHGKGVPREIGSDSTFKLLIGVQGINNPFEHVVYMSEKEIVKMNDYIERNGWDVALDSTGIRYEILKSNEEGEPIMLGDSIDLYFVYSTLKGRVIDRIRDNDTWKFQVGSNQTRVSGLNRLLTLMRDGEKARAIIPFSEAFGEEGMGHMIPPYTTLVMEIEAHKLKKE